MNVCRSADKPSSLKKKIQGKKRKRGKGAGVRFGDEKRREEEEEHSRWAGRGGDRRESGRVGGRGVAREPAEGCKTDADECFRRRFLTFPSDMMKKGWTAGKKTKKTNKV